MNAARADRLTRELRGRRVGGWLVRECVGYGKSALVFGAERDGKAAALKVFDPELIERFGKAVQEERIQRELGLRDHQHPNLIDILDGGLCPDTGHCFVCMSLINGPNLADVIQDIPRERIWDVISQVAHAAEFLETQRLAHRDIKPENIVISPDFEKATLLDLGVIRPIGEPGDTDDDQRVFVGTLRYSPPEFLLREEADTTEGWRAVTFYQLGGVLYDMLMRKPLFDGLANPYARLVNAVQHDVPDVQANHIPCELVLLARNCLVKDPLLRLKLVNWSDFAPLKGPDTALSCAKERIRRRMSYSQTQVCPQLPVQLRQEERDARRATKEIETELQSKIRQECVGSSLYPPIELHESEEADSRRAHFYVFLDASPDHAITTPLSLWFTVELLEQKSRAFRLVCHAAMYTCRLSHDDVRAHQGVPIYEGVYEKDSLENSVQTVLYKTLDRGQQFCEERPSPNATDQPIWLKVDEPDETGDSR